MRHRTIYTDLADAFADLERTAAELDRQSERKHVHRKAIRDRMTGEAKGLREAMRRIWDAEYEDGFMPPKLPLAVDSEAQE